MKSLAWVSHLKITWWKMSRSWLRVFNRSKSF